jgi:bifunctional non-homologous end joining protein LigD
MTGRVEPMLAVAGVLPIDTDQWAYEYKWDGVRCMTYWDGKRLILRSRNQIVITQRYPELAGLGSALGKRAAIFDGEIIALDTAGRPSFPELQRRMHVDVPAPGLVRQIPVWYVIFDVLYANRRSAMNLSYQQRREILDGLIVPGKHWQLSPFHIGSGQAMLESARSSGMEGVVAKQVDSPYLPGRRSPLWRKIKIIFGQEFVIGGWIPQAGAASDRVGALLLGYYETGESSQSILRYAGRVGSGFSDATHAVLVSSLKPLTTNASPFIEPIPRGGAIFVKPRLVAEVEYRRWPTGGSVQQASFKGLRDDKSPLKVVKEPQPIGAI